MFNILILVLCFCGGILCGQPTQQCAQPTQIPVSPLAKGLDNPFYDQLTLSYFGADILGDSIYRYSFKEKRWYSATGPGIVTPALCIPICGSDCLHLVASQENAFIVRWDGITTTASIVGLLFALPAGQTINSALIGPKGDIYVGSYNALLLCTDENEYSYFRYTPHNLVELADGFQSTVGSFLDENTNTLFHLDGCSYNLTSFYRCPCSGLLSNRCHVMQLNYPKNGIFLGLTGDSCGNLYTGHYLQGEMIKINPWQRKVTDSYKLPVALAGAPTFLGEGSNSIGITTAIVIVDFYGPSVVGVNPTPPNGYVFRFDCLNGQGTRSYRPVVDLKCLTPV